MAQSSELISLGTSIEYCYLCDVKTNGAMSSYTHRNGKRHKANVSAKEKEKSNPSLKRSVNETQSQMEKDGCPLKKTKAEDAEESERISCIICNEVFKSDLDALQHFKGKLHKSKVESKLLLLANYPTVTVTCDDCDLVFTSESLALQHFKGKTHVKKILERCSLREKRGGTIWCTVCSKIFSNDSHALAHYQSKAHTKKLMHSVGKPEGIHVGDESVNVGELQKAESSNEDSNPPEDQVPKEIKAVEGGQAGEIRQEIKVEDISVNEGEVHKAESSNEDSNTPEEQIPKEIQEAEGGVAEEEPTCSRLYCNLCNLTFHTEKNIFEHFNGSKHKTKVVQIRELSQEIEAKQMWRSQLLKFHL